MKRWFTALVAVLGMAGAGVAAAAPAASAATKPGCLVVVTPSDQSYTSLQAAVDAAASGDTLFVKGTCPSHVDINKNLTITGQSNGGTKTATLKGDAFTSVLKIGFVTVTLNNLIITGGDNLDPGGGINNFGTLTVNNSTITGNTDVNFDGDGGGGGIANGGTLTVNNSTITGNNATSEDGFGGGILNGFGTATVNNSTITGNNAGFGGGIYNQSGTLTLNGGSITGNTAAFGGGGIFNNGTVTGATATKITGNTPDNCEGSPVPGCVG